MPGEWLAQVPEDLRANESLTSYATLGDFAKAHVDTLGRVNELDGMVKASDGKVTDLTKRLESAIFRPGETATEAEKADFYKALGRPEKADGYEVAAPEGLPFTKDDIDWLKNVAYEIGLPKNSLESFAKKYFEKTQGDIQAVEGQIKARRDEATNALKKEWGGEFDAKLDAAKIAATKIGGDEFKAFLNDTGIGDHPQFIKAFHKISTMLSESSFVPGGPPPKNEPQRTEGGNPVLRFPSMEKK